MQTVPRKLPLPTVSQKGGTCSTGIDFSKLSDIAGNGISMCEYEMDRFTHNFYSSSDFVILKIQKLANGHIISRCALEISVSFQCLALDYFYQFAINCNSNLRQGLLNL